MMFNIIEFIFWRQYKEKEDRNSGANRKSRIKNPDTHKIFRCSDNILLILILLTMNGSSFGDVASSC